jgi:GNAT superfamily N-acetyltransferase
VVAVDGDHVVGYALVMLKEHASSIPMLGHMFDEMDRMKLDGRRLADQRYFVMGQVCVDKDHRGQGVFPALFEELKARMSADFDLVVTEIASRNGRSLKAHEKVGFRYASKYLSPDGESWEVVSWDWGSEL